MKLYYVYILECFDGSYYTGVTSEIEKRVNEHNEGIDKKCYTFNKRPLKLVFFENFSNINLAIEREKQIKGWSRKKKMALINGDFNELVRLSNLKKN